MDGMAWHLHIYNEPNFNLYKREYYLHDKMTNEQRFRAKFEFCMYLSSTSERLRARALHGKFYRFLLYNTTFSTPICMTYNSFRILHFTRSSCLFYRVNDPHESIKLLNLIWEVIARTYIVHSRTDNMRRFTLISCVEICTVNEYYIPWAKPSSVRWVNIGARVDK